MKSLFIVLLASCALLSAADSKFVYWSAGELRGYEKKLAPKLNEKKVATVNLNDFGGATTMIAHREGDGEAEVHDAVADFFVVQSGEATLVYGGTVENGKTTGPGETRGSSIKGGSRQTLRPGDVAHIPARMPHQLLVPKQFTYFVIKAKE